MVYTPDHRTPAYTTVITMRPMTFIPKLASHMLADGSTCRSPKERAQSELHSSLPTRLAEVLRARISQCELKPSPTLTWRLFLCPSPCPSCRPCSSVHSCAS